MYKVYCDNYLIHDDTVESLKVVAPTLSVELNAVGSFTFTIYPEHPYFDRLQKMKSIITVYQDGNIIFRGRILNDVNGFYNEKQVTCEGELAFLIDSIQRPYEFNGTPAELFTQLIEEHNSMVDEDHQFLVGNITVTDPNDYIARSDSTYQTTWDAIKSKLIDDLGGYLWVRHEQAGTYIDYLEDFNTLSSQKIEFGKNLLELKRTVKASDIFTVIIPLGAEVEVQTENPEDPDNPIVTKERVTIVDVNDGKDYLINQDAVNTYGRIVKMVEWKDVTDATNLKTKAQAHLDAAVYLTNSIDLTTADLSSMNSNIRSFRLGTKVQVISEPHGLDEIFLVSKLSIDLTNPSNNKLTLGASFNSLTEKQNIQKKNVNTQVHSTVESLIPEIVQETKGEIRDGIIQETTKLVESTIEEASDSIMTSVSENYYLKGETDDLIESITTEMTQTSEGWDFNFNEMKQNLNDLENDTDAQFEEIEKYIRFIDGSIFVGEVGNELELKIANDRISFIQNNSEVAYFTDKKMYVTDGQFQNSLRLGKFAFLPRTSGNLSFKKVVK